MQGIKTGGARNLKALDNFATVIEYSLSGLDRDEGESKREIRRKISVDRVIARRTRSVRLAQVASQRNHCDDVQRPLLTYLLASLSRSLSQKRRRSSGSLPEMSRTE